MRYLLMVERLGSLNLIPNLLQERAPVRALLECINKFTFPLDVTEEEWLRATKIVGDAAAADLSWMSEKHQRLFLGRCTDFVRSAFIKSWPGGCIAETES